MYTIGELCNRFNLSRSTLIYYNKIGLLVPCKRTDSNYRIYSEKDMDRLRRICLYKETGVSLKTIGEILEHDDQPALERRLIELNEELFNVREQQRLVMKMIQRGEGKKTKTLLTTRKFSNLLTAIGVTDEKTMLFHMYLEQASPREHRSFLKYLGLKDEEANQIIAKSRHLLKNKENS